MSLLDTKSSFLNQKKCESDAVGYHRLCNVRMLDYAYLLDVPEEIDYLEPHATLKGDTSKKATVYSEKTGDRIGDSWNTCKDSCHANTQCAGFTYYQGYCWKYGFQTFGGKYMFHDAVFSPFPADTYLKNDATEEIHLPPSCEHPLHIMRMDESGKPPELGLEFDLGDGTTFNTIDHIDDKPREYSESMPPFNFKHWDKDFSTLCTEVKT